MSLKTNLHGRLRNTSLPKNHGLLPLFEAVVNSVHAIEEAELTTSEGLIDIEIIRSSEMILDFDNKKKSLKSSDDIVGFKITDNGIGFNDINMKSFETLDSEHKIGKGGRGVGRLLWLKAFTTVMIDSVYNEGDGLKRRKFQFDMVEGLSEPVKNDVDDNIRRKTTIHLDGFISKYSNSSPKSIKTIANNLFEHCLWYFIRKEGAPKILIRDNDENINLDFIYEKHMHSSSLSETIEIKNNKFDLTHVKMRMKSFQNHSIALCAANRLVKEENISGKIPGLFGKIHDDKGDFIYTCYVCSEYLDNNVRSERTDFDIAENVDGFFEATEISLKDINEKILLKAKDHLSEYLNENIEKGKARVNDFISYKKPRYRPILSHLPEDMKIVDPSISDKDLDIQLHKQLSEIEEKLLAEGHDLMKPIADEDLPKYEERLQKYLNTAADIKKSDLANYVSHRKAILDLLADAIKIGKDGKYTREDLIHKLIMPMRKDSTEILSDSYNLWIVDERLAFHDYLASDKTLNSMPITGNTENKEPDIVSLNVFDNPILVSEGENLPLASIEIIEIKRPMRNDAKEGEEKDPIEQAIGYLDRIRNGNVNTASGRQIPESKNIPGYCYILCDITPSIRQRTRIHHLIKTSDGLGYFGYNPEFKAYIEVVSFDRLLNSAKERNRAFFDKLGLPAN
jgi:hypothetical protein